MSKPYRDTTMDLANIPRGILVFRQDIGSIMTIYIHNDTPSKKWSWTIITREVLKPKEEVFDAPNLAYLDAKRHAHVLLRDAQYDMVGD